MIQKNKVSHPKFLTLKTKGRRLQKSGFTLVELIVVITILAILGTIAFISLQGYSASSRDSVRVSDMSRIKSSLELFNIDAGKYPTTTAGVDVTFSGGTIWTQGTFGETTFTSVSRLDKIPKDPLIDMEYTYSVTNTRQEYEIAGIMEGDDFAMIDESYAAQKTARAMVTGHYNGKIAKVFTDGKTYVLAVPTIISASGVTLENIMLNKTFVYNGFTNLPFSYEGSSYNTLGENGTLNLVDGNNYIVFSGSLSNLTDPDNATSRISMLQNLQAAYTGSVIEDSAIDEILAITDFTIDNPLVVSLAGTVVNNTLGASIETSSVVTPSEVVVVDATPPSDYIAYYPLTGTAEDMTGNYDGVEVGNIYVDGGLRGSATLLDDGNYIDLLANKIPVIGESSFSFWLKFNNTIPTGVQHIITGDTGIGTLATSISPDYEGGFFYTWFSIVDNPTGTVNVNFSKTEFKHYVVQRNSLNDIDIYENGIYMGTQTGGGSDFNIEKIGRELLDRESYYLSELKIYDRTLSQTEITNIYNAELNTSPIAVSDGLVAYYPLKDNSKDNWFNQYDGINNGGVLHNDTGAVFDGGSTYLSTSIPSLGTDLSVSFWFKRTLNDVYHAFFTFSDGAIIDYSSGYGFGINTYNSDLYGITPTEFAPYSDGGWHHAIFYIDTISAINSKLYLDSIEISISQQKRTFITGRSFSNISIGGGAIWSSINGNLSKTRIYDRNISLEEVVEIYNTEKGAFGL